jgi:hypothetical protein
MKNDTLSQMSTVTEVLFQREFSAVQGILKEESAIRHSLAQLDAQSQSSSSNNAQDCAMQTIGADILWQAWVSKTRRQLNIELAQIVARKFEAIAHIRKAFGRKEAVKILMEKSREDRQKKAARLQAEQIQVFR